MGRIYTRLRKNQGPYCAPPAVIKPNTGPEPQSSQDQCFQDLIRFIASLGADVPYPKIINTDFTVARLAAHLGWPEDMVHQAFLDLIEDGALEYRFDGGLEFLPQVRRAIERGAV